MNSDNEKKNLRAKLLRQMEFYFSDSNLAKDRFLKQEIQNSTDGFIDLSLFLKFNKICSLSDDSKEIAKSLEYSDLLELNKDKTKVKRKIEFVEPSEKEINKRTIYVENLSSNISNDNLKKMFDSFGEISYISLPKFKSTSQSKGFAFIEFKQKSSAKNAVKHFKEINSTKSIEGKFPKSNPKIEQLEKQIRRVKELIKSHESQDSNLSSNREGLDSVGKKRKLNENEENHEIKRKKLNEEDLVNSLKVTSKKKWLKLREKFLEKQKEEIEKLKMELSQLDKQLKEKLYHEQQDKHPNIKIDDITKGCVVKLTMGLTDPGNDLEEVLKLTRQQFKTKKIAEEFHPLIAYVDIQKNANRIYIRCNSSDQAQAILKADTFLPEFSKSLLGGVEESEYFEKIYSNRNKKLEKKVKKETSSKQDDHNTNKREANEKKIKKDFIEMNLTSKEATSKTSHVIFSDEDD